MIKVYKSTFIIVIIFIFIQLLLGTGVFLAVNESGKSPNCSPAYFRCEESGFGLPIPFYYRVLTMSEGDSSIKTHHFLFPRFLIVDLLLVTSFYFVVWCWFKMRQRYKIAGSIGLIVSSIALIGSYIFVAFMAYVIFAMGCYAQSSACNG